MKQDKYLIGIDSGTTGTKVILFNTIGDIIDYYYQSYPLQIHNTDVVEQKPADWWTALVKGVRFVTRNVNKNNIIALSISTQGGTIIPLDKNNRLLSPAIVWLDTNSKKEAGQLIKKFGQDYFFKRTGHKIESSSVLPKIIKWKTTNSFYKKIKRIVQVNDYLMYCLTGNFISDPSNAAMSLMFNINTKNWDTELLSEFDIDNNVLSPIKPSGTVVGNLTTKTQIELGLNRNVLVINGCHDQYSAALGAGVIKNGDCLLSCGTAWVILCPTVNKIFEPTMKISTGVCATDNLYGLMAAMSNGNIVFDWVRNITGIINRTLENGQFDKNIFEKVKTQNDLIFVPHFVEGKGMFTGLNLFTDKYDILLSVMEGLVYETKCMIEILNNICVKPKKIVMIGGAAKSKVWHKIVADILQKNIVILKSPEAACRGAAMIAGLGCNIFKSSKEACDIMVKTDKLIKPDTNNDRYQKKFNEYKQLKKFY